MTLEKRVLAIQEKKVGRYHYLTTWAANSLFGTACDERDWRYARTIFIRYLAWLFIDKRRLRINIQNTIPASIRDHVVWIERQYTRNALGALPQPRSLEESFERALCFMTLMHVVRGPGSDQMAMMLGDYLLL